jgi:hypothetical protein
MAKLRGQIFKNKDNLKNIIIKEAQKEHFEPPIKTVRKV